MIGRRLAALCLAALVAGCGFHPVYGVQGPHRALASVYVGIIPNRSGQLLRQALQARLQGAASGVAQKYVLTVFFGEAIEGLGVQNDNSTTRNRNVGSATWALHPANDPTVSLAKGYVRSVDGYNVIDEQFFYQDLEQDAADHRLAQALADQIVMNLGLYFDKHPDAA